MTSWGLTLVAVREEPALELASRLNAVAGSNCTTWPKISQSRKASVMVSHCIKAVSGEQNIMWKIISITEWLRLEWTPGGHLVQAPTQGGPPRAGCPGIWKIWRYQGDNSRISNSWRQPLGWRGSPFTFVVVKLKNCQRHYPNQTAACHLCWSPACQITRYLVLSCDNYHCAQAFKQ